MPDNNVLSLCPISKDNQIQGTRHFAREKALQIIYAYEISGAPLELLFEHIFYRFFNFGEDDRHFDRLLKPEEIFELEADIPVVWEQEEIDFATDLIRFVFTDKEKIDKLIEDYLQNWDLSRVTVLDKMLIYLASAELLHFKNIPIKVSINEALELAKDYSTTKSYQFINGVLDTILEYFTKNGMISKEGKGLQEETENNWF
ncbi:MAG: transcription antitermination protein NusB [Bacteroidota bacterium]|nr:transcription antitermination protein NusB [Bacteroidota bacterium]